MPPAAFGGLGLRGLMALAMHKDTAFSLQTNQLALSRLMLVFMARSLALIRMHV